MARIDARYTVGCKRNEGCASAQPQQRNRQCQLAPRLRSETDSAQPDHSAQRDDEAHGQQPGTADVWQASWYTAHNHQKLHNRKRQKRDRLRTH
jgi:hypothetical protein